MIVKATFRLEGETHELSCEAASMDVGMSRLQEHIPEGSRLVAWSVEDSPAFV